MNIGEKPAIVEMVENELGRDLEEPEMQIVGRIEIVENAHPDMNAWGLAGKYGAIAHIEIVGSALYRMRA